MHGPKNKIELNIAKQTTGLFPTVRESLDVLLRFHVIPSRGFFFNLNWIIFLIVQQQWLTFLDVLDGLQPLCAMSTLGIK